MSGAFVEKSRFFQQKKHIENARDFLAFFDVHGVSEYNFRIRRLASAQSEIGNLRRFQLKLQFVCDKRDEFRIRGFSLGITDGIAEKSMQGIQIPSVPGYFDGMSDSTLHSGRGGLEGLRHKTLVMALACLQPAWEPPGWGL